MSQKSIYELDNDPSKSPLYGFVIDADAAKTGSVTMRGFGTHEGGMDAPLKWNAEKMRFDVDESTVAGYHILQAGTFLEYKMETQIQIVSPENTEVFRLVEDDKKELGKILFAGTYQTEEGKEVVFEEDGTLSGLGQKTQYQLLSDFGEGLLFDAVFFKNIGDAWDDQDIYHFKIKENTIELYPVTGTVPEYEIGELKYKLTKQN